MANFSFKTNLIVLMRVRANSEMVARKVVPTVLRAPSAAEIRLANEGTAFLFEGAIVTDVDFFVDDGSIELIETVRRSELTPAATGYEQARVPLALDDGVKPVRCKLLGLRNNSTER